MKDYDLRNFVQNVRACITKMLKRRRSAFTLAEVTTVIIVMLGIILLTGRLAIGDRQKEYNAKFDKISTSISSNISHDLISKTGFEFADYTKANGNDYFQAAVINNISDGTTCNNCWSAGNEVTIGGKKYENLNNMNKWRIYKLNDNSIMAVNKNTTDILVDVNGAKGPNMPDKDVRAYKYPAVKTRHGGDVNAGYGPANPINGSCDDEIAIGTRKEEGRFTLEYVKEGEICYWKEINCANYIEKPAADGPVIVTFNSFYDSPQCKYNATCPAPKERAGSGTESDKYRCICKSYPQNPNFEGTVLGWENNNDTCMSDPTCAEPKERTGSGTADDKYKCLCKNRDASNHEVSSESTVTWTLSDECVWGCQNSRTNPGDNIHTYYEQKTNCDWDLKKECLNPTKLSNDKTQCICDVITNVGYEEDKHNNSCNAALNDDEENSCAKLTDKKFKETLDGATIDNSCKSTYSYECNTNFAEKAIDYNENAIVRTATKDPTTCDYTYTYQCKSFLPGVRTVYDNGNASELQSACDLNYTGTGNKQECKDMPAAKYTKQRTVYKNGNTYSCKWEFGCNDFYAEKAIDYDENTVVREAVKRDYGYSTDTSIAFVRSVRVDGSECDYSYTYGCKSDLSGHDRRKLEKGSDNIWRCECANDNNYDDSADKPKVDASTGAYIYSKTRLNSNGTTGTTYYNNEWGGTNAYVSTGPCGYKYLVSCRVGSATLNYNSSKGYYCSNASNCPSGQTIKFYDQNPNLFDTLNNCLANSNVSCGKHPNSVMNYSNYAEKDINKSLMYSEFSYTTTSGTKSGADFFYVSCYKHPDGVCNDRRPPEGVAPVPQITSYTRTNTGYDYHITSQRVYEVTDIRRYNGQIYSMCIKSIPDPPFICESPLSFDIDGNGITTKDEIIEYDINGDGTLDKINNSADAILCFDRDKDGICGKDGSELFGNNTRFGFEDENFKSYADGFEALKALARHEGLISDDDNELDEDDIKYLEDKWGLRIKKDGYLSESEKLSDNKITSIKTSNNEKHWYENFDDKGNNLMVQEGSSFTIDNKVNVFADIWHKITEKVEDFVSGITDSISNLFGGGK